MINGRSLAIVGLRGHINEVLGQRLHENAR